MSRPTLTSAQVAQAAVSALLQDLQARPATGPTAPVVLLPAALTYADYGSGYRMRSENGSQDIYMWLRIDGKNPGTWVGFEDRVDAAGDKWCRNIGPMRPDDFGNLFEAAR
jgi:hypothetical protein